MSQDYTRPHLTDEELLLDYYGEGSSDRRVDMQAHLEACDACRTLDRELRGVLALVDTEPVPDAPPGFEREMWARIEPQIAAKRAGLLGTLKPRSGEGGWKFELPRWAFAAAAVALAVGSFMLGRVWSPVPAPATEQIAEASTIGERVLRSEVEEHLERSQRVLVELVNADDSAPVMLASDRAQAADLVAAGRLYRLNEMGDAETRDLLEDIERVLVDVANGPVDETSNDLSGVRARISDQDLIFRLRVMTSAMRARQQRARPTW